MQGGSPGNPSETTRMLDRVATLTGDLQSRIQAREEQRTRGEIKLAEQIKQLQRKAVVIIALKKPF